MKILFLDIETTPVTYKYEDLNDETKALWDKKWLYNETETSEQRYNKAGVYAEFAKVVCISMGNFYNGKFYVKSIVSTDEKELLTQFSEQSPLCTQNSR